MGYISERLGGHSGTMKKRKTMKVGLRNPVSSLRSSSTESGSDAAHDDKRAHGSTFKDNQGGLGRKGGRKSGLDGDDQGKPGRDSNKAARRKEQNRAAQKAFRERRENKVRDVSTENPV